MITSCSLRSVVNPRRNSWGPELWVPRLSQELPAQPMGPCTTWATSAMGNRVICAPSKAQPPAVAPGLPTLQPDFDLPLCGQAGSSINTAISLPFIAITASYDLHPSTPTSVPGAFPQDCKGHAKHN